MGFFLFAALGRTCKSRSLLSASASSGIGFAVDGSRNPDPIMQLPDKSLLDRLVQLDRQRPGIPGEHWLAFAAGVYLLLQSRRTATGRLASTAAGALLVARALTGRDGAIAYLERQAERGVDAGLTEIAAPWPYDQRVRVSTPHRTRRNQQSDASSETVPSSAA